MTTIRTWALGALLAVAGAGIIASAQEQKAGASTTDPRVALKPGLYDAGVAARHIELMSTLPKPTGFFDPSNPKGDASPPERPAGAPPVAPQAPPAPPAAAAPGAPGAPPAMRGGGLDFSNSDLAFSGKHMFVGNFHGFNTYDIESPRKPRLLRPLPHHDDARGQRPLPRRVPLHGSQARAPHALLRQARAHGQASSTAPTPIRAMPSQPSGGSRSPSTSTPNTATSTTLSLSIGATFATGPSARARK